MIEYTGTGHWTELCHRIALRLHLDYIPIFLTIIGNFCSDINKVKDGMSDKVSMAVQWMTAFLAGFIIAFFYEWKLTLVIMSTSPLLAIAGFLFSKVCTSTVYGPHCSVSIATVTNLVHHVCSHWIVWCIIESNIRGFWTVFSTSSNYIASKVHYGASQNTRMIFLVITVTYHEEYTV